MPGAGGFGAKTQQAARAPAPAPVPTPTSGGKAGPLTGMQFTPFSDPNGMMSSMNQMFGSVPAPGPGKGGPSAGNQPTFNLPNAVQPDAQNPIGQYQTPPPAQNPPIAGGNFGTIQPQPYPVSGVAMPTPNPVPQAPPPNLPGAQQIDSGTGSPPVMGGPMSPGSMGKQVAQQQGGMNALPGMGGALQSVGGAGGPPQMTFQDWINQGSTPEQAQQMMSQFGPK
jgi:hypothetical protein